MPVLAGSQPSAHDWVVHITADNAVGVPETIPDAPITPSSDALLAGQADLPAAPAYGKASIGDVLSSAAAVLGAQAYTNVLKLPPAQRICVVLVDGLGKSLLKQRASHTPFLRGIMAADSGGEHPRTLHAAFPSTTATSLTALGTGAVPGQHGMVGYDVLDPRQDKVVNLLGNWDSGVDPLRWQPIPTVFEKLPSDVVATTVSLPKFADSAMTRAALRGSRFSGATSTHARVEQAVEALAATPKALVYLYWSELDKAGHHYGADSPQWERQLEELDAGMKRLAAAAPSDTLILLTADHGMVDIPRSDRIDYSEIPELVQGVRHTAGEPRMVHLYLEPEATPECRDRLMAAWLEHFRRKAWVLTREQAVAAGYFGAVSESVGARIGDVLILARESVAFYDLRRVRLQAMDVVGQHGSITKAEREVPLLRIPVTAKKAKGKRR
ncbi:alkaline phosphatase family protein [Arthrobacter alpinus]|uniref:alkaline phosphatase family protein n=1 Tax=Arthrobacter alpinus TaxID=656366 RepID=UPI0009EB95E6|nr:nucleotide pyrophosphatase/phosphodiesterase family protein [Arthrobacter alpinus]